MMASDEKKNIFVEEVIMSMGHSIDYNQVTFYRSKDGKANNAFHELSILMDKALDEARKEERAALRQKIEGKRVYVDVDGKVMCSSDGDMLYYADVIALLTPPQPKESIDKCTCFTDKYAVWHRCKKCQQTAKLKEAK